MIKVELMSDVAAYRETTDEQRKIDQQQLNVGAVVAAFVILLSGLTYQLDSILRFF